MTGFVDETEIVVASGKGGHGAVSFRREKYVPRGGPDGGDGGKGGDVIFKVKQNLKTLSRVKGQRVFKAQNGQPGAGRRKHGSDGRDAVVFIPPGTIIKDSSSKEIIKDFAHDTEWTFLKGGKGGRGNWHFATSTKQAPRYAQGGIEGEERKLLLELHVIADVGFVGFPNAGKSSLLAALTNAHPKIADYPFTTKTPNLGVVDLGFKDMILADIPGIIEGASAGHGLGHRFLKHISRTAGLAIVIDVNEKDPRAAYETLLDELEKYSGELLKKKRFVVASKIDLDVDHKNEKSLREAIPEELVVGFSSFAYTGVDKLKEAFLALEHNTSPEWEKV